MSDWRQNQEQFAKLNNPGISKEERERIRDQLIEANQPLVHSIVAAFLKKRLNRDVHSSEDLYQECLSEGNIALVNAVEKFDPDLGNKFSPYASKAIYHKLGDFFKENTTTRVAPEAQRRLHVAQKSLKEELAELSESDREAFLIKMFPPQHLISEVLRAKRGVTSLDTTPLSKFSTGGEGTSLGQLQDASLERINGARKDSPLGALEKKELLDHLDQALKSLSEVEQDMLLKHYGLRGHKPHTLEAIGKDHGVSRERVRQIIAQARKLLRSALSETEDKER